MSAVPSGINKFLSKSSNRTLGVNDEMRGLLIYANKSDPVPITFSDTDENLPFFLKPEFSKSENFLNTAAEAILSISSIIQKPDEEKERIRIALEGLLEEVIEDSGKEAPESFLKEKIISEKESTKTETFKEKIVNNFFNKEHKETYKEVKEKYPKEFYEKKENPTFFDKLKPFLYVINSDIYMGFSGLKDILSKKKEDFRENINKDKKEENTVSSKPSFNYHSAFLRNSEITAATLLHFKEEGLINLIRSTETNVDIITQNILKKVLEDSTKKDNFKEPYEIIIPAENFPNRETIRENNEIRENSKEYKEVTNNNYIKSLKENNNSFKEVIKNTEIFRIVEKVKEVNNQEVIREPSLPIIKVENSILNKTPGLEIVSKVTPEILYIVKNILLKKEKENKNFNISAPIEEHSLKKEEKVNGNLNYNPEIKSRFNTIIPKNTLSSPTFNINPVHTSNIIDNLQNLLKLSLNTLNERDKAIFTAGASSQKNISKNNTNEILISKIDLLINIISAALKESLPKFNEGIINKLDTINGSIETTSQSPKSTKESSGLGIETALELANAALGGPLSGITKIGIEGISGLMSSLLTND